MKAPQNDITYQGDLMLAYELHRAHHAELVREAEAQRLVGLARAARKARRTASRGSGDNAPEGRVRTHRSRFTQAA
ncbi:hypothetical protein [Streptomyces sp. SP18CS02]|uniref:hypothetical protein n=1 Tax=Streptomyces sp. SP18CS02 TaxID=3002531 RepID=UPI002E765701|nr:hypothetical protein [Streptomyces sp. SP18CS02]MEE1757052.1 hypothetical protein [Streptomyces sp. SP18CS02]